MNVNFSDCRMVFTSRLEGPSIRVLLRTRPDGSRYAAAQPTAVRDETARDMAVRTLLPIAALIPCLLIVTALVIAHSLRPMVRLAGNLDARRADDLTPLPNTGAPSELHPFITSINGLLARMRLLMDQQRRFVADAAHELRTPITALSLQAENLDSVELPEAARERVAALKQGMHRTKHLLEQLLAVARHEAKPFSGEMRRSRSTAWQRRSRPICCRRRSIVASISALKSSKLLRSAANR